MCVRLFRIRSFFFSQYKINKYKKETTKKHINWTEWERGAWYREIYIKYGHEHKIRIAKTTTKNTIIMWIFILKSLKLQTTVDLCASFVVCAFCCSYSLNNSKLKKKQKIWKKVEDVGKIAKSHAFMTLHLE